MFGISEMNEQRFESDSFGRSAKNMDPATAVRTFISYAHKDEGLRDELVTHLSLLKRESLISEWHDRKIMPGQEWETEIDSNLRSSKLILLLVSPDFLASDYCFGKELTIALERHEGREAAVVPIIVRPSDWKRAPFARHQAIPKDGMPVTTWPNRDEAWLDVATRLRELIIDRRKSLVVRDGTSEVHSIHDLLTREVERISARYERYSIYGGLPTGFPEFDDLTDGLHPGDLVVVAARPNMGRSDFMLGLVKHAAVDQRVPAVLFSLRTGTAGVIRKLTSAVGQIADSDLLRVTLTDNDWSQMTNAVAKMHDAPLFIDGSSELSLAALSERCKHLNEQYGKLALVVVDGVEQLECKSPSKNRDALTLPRALKRLAQELAVSVVVSANISRKVEARPNKRPVLRDLEDWEHFEEEADVIAFLYREGIYNVDTSDTNAAELIVAKNVRGLMGTVRLTYRQQFSRFDSAADTSKVVPKDSAE